MITDLPILDDLREVSRVISDRGWGEANAGNVSFRILDLDMSLLDGIPRYVALETGYPMISGRKLLITRTGTRFRDLYRRPEDHLLLIEVLDHGYQVLAGEGDPTLELPVHLSIHDMLQTTRPEHRAVLHVHPTSLLAFGHLPIKDRLGTLMRMHPETYFHLPEGIRFLPYELPGTEELASITVKALGTSRVCVWDKHGVTSTGHDLSHALDPVEILDKAADMYLRVAPALRSEMSRIGLSDEEVEATSRTAGYGTFDDAV